MPSPTEAPRETFSTITAAGHPPADFLLPQGRP